MTPLNRVVFPQHAPPRLPGAGTALGVLLCAAVSHASASDELACHAGLSPSACIQEALSADPRFAGETVVVRSLGPTPAFVPRMRIAEPVTGARVSAMAADDSGRDLTLAFGVERWRDVPVWTQAAPAGAPAAAGAPRAERRNVTSLPPGEALVPVDWQTAVLRHAVRRGDLLQRQDLKTPDEVAPGDRIRFQVSENGVRVSAPGRALEAGRIGQTLRVLPAHSSRPALARITETP